MVHLDDLHVPVGAELLRRLAHQPREQGHAERGVAGLQHGDLGRRRVDQRMVMRVQSGGADDDRGTRGARRGEVRLERGRRSEIDQHIRGLRERRRIVPGIDAPGERRAEVGNGRGDRLAHAPRAAENADRGHCPCSR